MRSSIVGGNCSTLCDRWHHSQHSKTDLCGDFHPWYTPFTSGTRFTCTLCHQTVLLILLLFNSCLGHRVLQKEIWDRSGPVFMLLIVGMLRDNLCNSCRDITSELCPTEMQEQKI